MRKRLTKQSTLSGFLLAALLCLAPPHAGHAAQFFNTACGYSVTYPDSWSTEMHPDGRNLVLRSCPLEAMPLGQLFPPGGASITIQMFPPYTGSIKAKMTTPCSTNSCVTRQ